MKRESNLFQKIISIENLILADEKAQKGKAKQYGVVFTGSKTLMDLISQVPKDGFPFKTTIKKNDKRLEFT